MATKNLKIDVEILDLFREIYNIPLSTSYKDIVLYAISSSLPKMGRTAFANDYKLDKKLTEKIVMKRDSFTKDTQKGDDIKKEISSIDASLKELQKSSDSFNTIENLLLLILANEYSLSTNKENLIEYINTEDSKKLKAFAKAYRKGDF
ncbi:hypothetical protein [Staphylococcus hyicus]|uniref:hypothetical protein n=1 Tax=Staphylococcus hyicus TaxID=1284 RepID=UPI0031334B99